MDVKVYEERWKELQGRVEKSNRKASVLGVEPLVLTRTGTAVEDEPLDDNHPNILVPRSYALGTLVGVAPTLAGWTFVAALDHLGTSNIIRRFDPDAVVPDDWKMRASTCDHCQNQRRRKTTFFLKDANGHLKQVGSSCLKDFLGFNMSPETMVRLAEIVSSFRVSDGPVAHHEVGEPVKWVLMNALAVIRKMGFFRSSKTAKEKNLPSTRSMVSENMAVIRNRSGRRDLPAPVHPSPKDIEDAAAIIEWGKALEAHSEYEENMKTVLCMLEVSPVYEGLVVAAAWSWMKATNCAPNYVPVQKQGSTSNWVGAVGDVLQNVSATVLNVFSYSTEWGDSQVYKFITEDGDLLTWFTSSMQECDKGDKVVILRARIKEHKEFRGLHETQLTRAKVAVVQKAVPDVAVAVPEPLPA